MPSLLKKRSEWLIVLGICSAISFALGCSQTPAPPVAAKPRALKPTTAVAAAFPLRDSPYLNTKPDAQYVGNQACVDCHAEEYASYSQTTHSKALNQIDLKDEPPDCRFVHERSGRTYEVLRDQGQVWHVESIELTDRKPDVWARYPMRYVIGSGNHSRSYLAEIDGFLVESPLTWYRSRMAWGMSPGYDRPWHAGFERLADFGCLQCHAGRVEMDRGNRFKVKIHEMSIGCENCHGPGSLHVAHRKSQESGKSANKADDIDYTTLNPAKLSREDAEAICAQCHLRGDATVPVHGRMFNDFRPGQRLSDFRVDYFLEQSDKFMKVVGHMEQMRLSRCYRESPQMTCTTCHDPHQPPREEMRVEYFRERCLSCHKPEACRLDLEQRIKQNAADDCVACHMPRGATDLAHFAFTHHQIGIHGKEPADPAQPQRLGKLVPASDISHLPETEQQRLLGLAYLEFSEKQSQPAAQAHYLQQAARLLETVDKAGTLDAEGAAELARIYWTMDNHTRALQLARTSLAESESSANALFVAGDTYFRQGDLQSALGAFQKLVEKRRHSEDWLMLATCQYGLGDYQAALASLQRAAAINPGRSDITERLIELSDRLGPPSLAQEYRARLGSIRALEQRQPASAK